MQHFYDGQLRRYITQTIRFFSNFVVKNGDGTLQRIPVAYGDPDRQSATIIRQNSENAINSVPKISIYISGLDLDRDRLADATYVGKTHFRERDVNAAGNYTKPELRKKIVAKVKASATQGTKAGEWSARKAQLVAKKYKAAGGGYKD